MRNRLAIDLLLRKRSEVTLERNKMLEKYNNDISEMEAAIEELSGKTVWETAADYLYDDENPDYIKGSIEG